jgi:hypothetical protein
MFLLVFLSSFLHMPGYYCKLDDIHILLISLFANDLVIECWSELLKTSLNRSRINIVKFVLSLKAITM